MNTITMEATIQFKTKEPLTKPLSDLGYEVGDFSFHVQSPVTKETVCIPFDFDAFSVSASPCDQSVCYETGRGLLFNEYSISEDYKEGIEESGISFDDVTAEVLANTTYIYEFHFSVVDRDYLDLEEVVIKEIKFSDDKKTYSVSDEVLSVLNKQIKEELNVTIVND